MHRRHRSAHVFVAATLIATIVHVAGAATSVGAQAPLPPAAKPPKEGKLVRLTALDGVRLEGRLYGKGPLGVVLTHQLDSDASEWDRVAKALAALGYRALAINVRGTCPGDTFGCSQGSFAPQEIWQDTAGAARYLRAHGARSIVLIGGSMGGEASLIAAARTKAGVVGVVSLSGSAGFVGPLDPAEERMLLRRVRVPKLFVAGSRDDQAPQAAAAYQAIQRPPKRLLVVGSDAHGVALLEDPSVGATVTKAVFAFLRART